MEKNKLSPLRTVDLIVILAIVGAFGLFFLFNFLADLFLQLSIKQEWLQRAVIVAISGAAIAFLCFLIIRRQPDSLELTQHSLEERVQQRRKLRISIVWWGLMLMAFSGFYVAIFAGWLDNYFKIENPLFGLTISIVLFTPRLISESIHYVRLSKIISALRTTL